MPRVAIIVPCYNEQDRIGLLLQAVLAQTYPHSDLELVIADGISTDHTRQVIERFQKEHSDLMIRIVDNEHRSIPSGLNHALRAAQSEMIVRLDAHSIPYPDYVERCVAALRQGRGDNVGGLWEILPGGDNWLARSIAATVAHPLGAGDARYRIGGQAQTVDTVPFGAFYRSLVEKIGYFDESLLTNEDYEFNVRIRQSGGKVWMDPCIRSRYFARANLSSLWKQYWRYGYWKAKMLKRYPHTLRWRQAIPPLFVLSLVILSLLGFWLPALQWLLLGEVVVYGLALLSASIYRVWKDRYLPYLVGMPLAFIVIHLAWGSSVLVGSLSNG
jgi:glycosyltransferase involved in cell wall biosynthesis